MVRRHPDVEVDAIAKDLDVKPEVVREMEGRLSAFDAGFDASPSEDDEQSSYQAPAQYLDDARYDPAVQLEDSDWEADSTRRLQKALGSLDERSRHILQSRWLADNKATLHELAGVYGVSAERIRPDLFSHLQCKVFYEVLNKGTASLIVWLS